MMDNHCFFTLPGLVLYIAELFLAAKGYSSYFSWENAIIVMLSAAESMLELLLYSRTSVARTLMARLPRLFRTRS